MLALLASITKARPRFSSGLSARRLVVFLLSCVGSSFGFFYGDPSFPLSERLYPIDCKAFSLKESDRISAEGAVLYQKGWSLRDIGRELGCSKNKVRAELQKAGQKIREGTIQATHNRKTNAGKQGALPYFGFCYFEGRIVADPREFPTLKLIHRLWKQEKTIHLVLSQRPFSIR